MTVSYFEARKTRPMTATTGGDLQKAREQRIANHFYRKYVLACLADGHMTLAQFREKRREDKRLNCLRVKVVVRSIVGAKRAQRFLQELKIDGDKKVVKLGPREWHELIGRVDSTWRSVGSRR